uniref:Probable Ca2+-transporting ATPase (Fragments) n=1 Tax=Rattus norvegicus TaxID=10116 RepID=Q7M038_RAT
YWYKGTTLNPDSEIADQQFNPIQTSVQFSRNGESLSEGDRSKDTGVSVRQLTDRMTL